MIASFISIISKPAMRTGAATPSTSVSAQKNCNLSRRHFATQLARTAAGALILPLLTGIETNAQESGQLPAGAKQFSNVISAQRQWNSVKDAFTDGRTPDEEEWKNLRTYLRAVFAVSEDMEFLSRRWEKARRESGQKTISDFRSAVRALDKPAAKQDIPMFLEGHAQVSSLFDQFFSTLKQDTIGDMPADL